MTEPINFSAKNKNVLRINKINENENTGDTERMFNFIFLVNSSVTRTFSRSDGRP